MTNHHQLMMSHQHSAVSPPFQSYILSPSRMHRLLFFVFFLQMDAMIESGQVLRFRSLIFEDPDTVALAVQSVLPELHKSVADLREDVLRVEKELEPFEETKKVVNSSANLKARLMTWGALGIMVLQLAAFVRLTYFELSWDVMEPTAYFAQILTSVILAGYFMLVGREAGYESMYDALHARYTRKGLAAKAFDEAQYQRLQNLLINKRQSLNLARKLGRL